MAARSRSIPFARKGSVARIPRVERSRVAAESRR